MWGVGFEREMGDGSGRGREEKGTERKPYCTQRKERWKVEVGGDR